MIWVKRYKGKDIYKHGDHYEIEGCSKQFSSIGECKRFINFMREQQ